jgi:AcrR family transcriptional regulator
MTTSAGAHKARRLAEREGRIVAAARALAEERGWESVTTRRLANAIGYSQPVLYGHFPEGKSQIVTAVALVGFDELAAAMSVPGSAPDQDARGADRVRAVVTTYLDFAERHPATYEAMFRLPIRAPFASAETPRSLRDAFDAIVGALRALDQPPADLGTAAEVLWGAMHGVATLRRAARFNPEHHERRVDELVRYFAG